MREEGLGHEIILFYYISGESTENTDDLYDMGYLTFDFNATGTF